MKRQASQGQTCARCAALVGEDAQRCGICWWPVNVAIAPVDPEPGLQDPDSVLAPLVEVESIAVEPVAVEPVTVDPVGEPVDEAIPADLVDAPIDVVADVPVDVAAELPPFAPYVPPTGNGDAQDLAVGDDYITEPIPVVLVSATDPDGRPLQTWAPLPGGLLPGPAPFGVAHQA